MPSDFLTPNKSISIHALREESDEVQNKYYLHPLISIHALREESDFYNSYTWFLSYLFQSTLSVRRATVVTSSAVNAIEFQSTLSVMDI